MPTLAKVAVALATVFLSACQNKMATPANVWVDGATLRSAGKLPQLQPILEVSLSRDPLAITQVRRMQGQISNKPTDGAYRLELLAADGTRFFGQSFDFHAQLTEVFDGGAIHAESATSGNDEYLRIPDARGASRLRLVSPAGDARSFDLSGAQAVETADLFQTLQVTPAPAGKARDGFSITNNSSYADVVFVPQAYASQTEFQQAIQAARAYLDSVPTFYSRGSQIRFNSYWTTVDLGCDINPFYSCDRARLYTMLDQAQVPYDAIVVLGKFGTRGVTFGNAANAYPDPSVIIHEMSHALFGLADEYVSMGTLTNFPTGVQLFSNGNCAYVPNPNDPIQFPYAGCMYSNTYRSADKSIMSGSMSSMTPTYSPAADRQIGLMLDMIAGPLNGTSSTAPLAIVRSSLENTAIVVQTNKLTVMSAQVTDYDTGVSYGAAQTTTPAFSNTLQFGGIPSGAHFKITATVMTSAGEQAQVTKVGYILQLTQPAVVISDYTIDQITSASARVTWNTDKPTAGSLQIRACAATDFQPAAQQPVAGAVPQQVTLSGLSTGCYQVRVALSLSDGTIEYSSILPFKIPVPVAPNAPSGLQVVSTDSSSATLAWTHDGLNVTGFKVVQVSGATSWDLGLAIAASARQVNVPGLSAGATYYFEVKAINGTLQSPVSNLVLASTAAPPTPSLRMTSSVPFIMPGSLGFAASNASGLSGQWVGLFPAGSSNYSYVAWSYVTGTSPSGVLSVPSTLTPGQYVLRLFRDGGYTMIAESTAFGIQSQSSTTTSSGSAKIQVTSATPFTPGAYIGFAASGASNQSGQWVGIAPQGSSPYTYSAYTYVYGTSPSGSFYVPSSVAAGYYVLRLFQDGGYTQIAESAPFYVY